MLVPLFNGNFGSLHFVRSRGSIGHAKNLTSKPPSCPGLAPNRNCICHPPCRQAMREGMRMRGSGSAREQHCCHPWRSAPCVAIQMEGRATLPPPGQRLHEFFVSALLGTTAMQASSLHRFLAFGTWTPHSYVKQPEIAIGSRPDVTPYWHQRGSPEPAEALLSSPLEGSRQF